MKLLLVYNVYNTYMYNVYVNNHKSKIMWALHFASTSINGRALEIPILTILDFETKKI